MQMKYITHRALQLFIVIGLVLVQFVPFAPNQMRRAQAVSNSVVISQVYGGGGNTDAAYKQDFIELLNISSSTVSLTGLSLQYGSTTGDMGGGASYITPLPGVDLLPGHYLLIQEAQGAGGTTDLPAPDVTAVPAIAISASGGKVALVTGAGGLLCGSSTNACSDAQKARIVDLIAWGSNVSMFEGMAGAPATANTTAIRRKGEGCTETDSNINDWAVGAPTPRNSKSPINDCAASDTAPMVSSTIPANDAPLVLADTQIKISFSENVNVADGWFTISCSVSNSHGAAVSGGPQNFTLVPDVAFSAGETCTVTVVAAQVTDQDANDPPDRMTSNFSWKFTIIPTTINTIHETQGGSHYSALHNQLVSNVAGIVTALRKTGFYMQDIAPDDDPNTSEGIFVFTSTAPTVKVGDAVQVAGSVLEFRSGGTNLSITEITGPVISILSSDNPLPVPIILGTGGRVPPNTVIEDDTAIVDTGNTFDPSSDGVDFFETVEGMRVQVNDAQVVGPTSSFGEIPVVGDAGANAGLLTARGGLVIQADDYNPERIILDNEVMNMPTVNVGDSFPGAIIGVMDYSFGNYKLEVSSLPAVQSGGLQPEVAPQGGLYKLSVGTFNVENLSPSDPAQKFNTLASLIVNHLESPDILAVEEIQDNSGPTDNGIVAAEVTYNTLIAAIQSAGGPQYEFRQINPVNDQDGGQPGGNIRVGFLFRGDRGIKFVDRAGGDAITSNAVLTGGGVHLKYSPGRIDPTNTAFDTSRKPLAGEFTFNGETLFVIANHFNSKIGDQPLFGRYQPPALPSEVQRVRQAQVVHDFVAGLLAADAQARVVVLGDLNDFQFSIPLTILKGDNGFLYDLIETLPKNEQYTYVFDGNSQAIDHILVSDALYQRPFVYDAVHVNSEFAVKASDHDPQVVVLTMPNHKPQVTVVGEIPDQKADNRAGFQMKFEAQPFIDVDAGDVLSLKATLSDGSPLPAWLSFDPVTRTFSGMPGPGDCGDLVIKLSATDLGNESASISFRLKVTTLIWFSFISNSIPIP